MTAIATLWFASALVFAALAVVGFVAMLVLLALIAVDRARRPRLARAWAVQRRELRRGRTRHVAVIDVAWREVQPCRG